MKLALNYTETAKLYRKPHVFKKIFNLKLFQVVMGGSGNIKSSNSQLFKGSEGSGAAIPLTFNNSIAEVLAAAAGKTKLNKSREPSPKPEITITAKNSKIGSNTSIEALKITKKNSGNTVGNLGKLFFTAH